MAVTTLRELLRGQDNDYDAEVAAVEARTGTSWRERVDLAAAPAGSLSVVIPAHDNAYSVLTVLDALASSTWPSSCQVIVVDDGSADGTAQLARGHDLRPRVVALPGRLGAPVARNVGTAVADGDTVVYLDADMVLPPHVLTEFAVRASQRLVLVGFRHNVDFAAGPAGRALLPPSGPDIEQDHRVAWHAGPGTLIYSGMRLDRTVEGRPLDDTQDLRLLGRGAWYHDWDLPRMVVTALVCAPRAAVMRVGGFEPAFGDGWGAEDTHLGAKLIASGLKVAPVRPAVGFHIDPPDAAAAWRRKLAVWPRNVALYWRLLDEPAPNGGRAGFVQHTNAVLRGCEVLG
jgi:GT2 family glycosyltransferase